MNPCRAAAAVLAALALGSCGGGDDEAADSDSAAAPAERPKRAQGADRRANLPDSWSTAVNRRGGFTFGVPRGWRVDDDGPVSLVRSFDRLVAISLGTDRSPGALELEPREFAAETAGALRGYRGEPRLGRVRGFAHPRYAAAEVRARAISRAGVRQRISVIALRRGDLATIIAIVAANERQVTDPDERLARDVVRSVRTRPPSDQRSGRSG